MLNYCNYESSCVWTYRDPCITRPVSSQKDLAMQDYTAEFKMRNGKSTDNWLILQELFGHF